MAITCKWKNPLGTCTNKYGAKITIYGGGNCVAVFCFSNRNLENFIIDKKHFINCNYEGNEYKNITIYRDRKKESEELIRLLLLANFEFKVKNTKRRKNNDKTVWTYNWKLFNNRLNTRNK